MQYIYIYIYILTDKQNTINMISIGGFSYTKLSPLFFTLRMTFFWGGGRH